jgi:hypothetical protein
LHVADQKLVTLRTWYSAGQCVPKTNCHDLALQANGVLAYFTTLALFVVGWQLQLFKPARVYDLFGEILAGLNLFSLLLCLFLYFKVCVCINFWSQTPAKVCPNIEATLLTWSRVFPVQCKASADCTNNSAAYSQERPPYPHGVMGIARLSEMTVHTMMLVTGQVCA